jgi:hypothetical protein
VADDSQRKFDEFISDITPDVIAVLKRQSFFELLEKETFPDGIIGSSTCRHDFSATTELLSQLGHDADAIRDVIDVMRANGGFCDCEIVLNAAPESKVREAYWKAQHGKLVDGKR